MRKLMMPLLVLFGVSFVAVNVARAEEDKRADAKPAKKAKKSKKAKKAGAPPPATRRPTLQPILNSRASTGALDRGYPPPSRALSIWGAAQALEAAWDQAAAVARGWFRGPPRA